MRTRILTMLLIASLALGMCQIPAKAEVKNQPKRYSLTEFKVRQANRKMEKIQNELDEIREDDDEWYDEIVVNTKTGSVKKDGEMTTLKKALDVPKSKEKSLVKSKTNLKKYISKNTACDVVTDGNKVILSNNFQYKRLMVVSDKKITDTFGASERIDAFNNNVILSYETEEECENAYHRFSKMKGVTVSADSVVEATDVNQESNVDVKEIPSLSQVAGWDVTAAACWSFNATSLCVIDSECSQYNMEDTIVAVVDTGCDMTNPELQSHLLTGHSFTGGVGGTDPSDIDADGHGTHVAGIIAACTPSDKIKILPIAVFHIVNGESKAYEADINLAIDYAVEAGADVINMSLGASVTTPNNCIPSEKKTIDNATAKGVVCVAGAGNDKKDVMFFTPANLSNTVAVSAIKQDLAFDNSYSNYGEGIDFCAPGTDIYSTVPASANANRKAWMSGTSMATPHISAFMAYIKSLKMTYNKDQCVTALSQFCRDLGTTGKDVFYGYGMPLGSSILNTLGVKKGTVVYDPATCPHAHNVKVATTAATCTEIGHNTFHCTDCGAYYVEEIPALGHDNVLIDVKDATCTEDGYKKYECSRCHEISTIVLEKLGHDYECIDTKDATCTEDGYKKYECSRCHKESTTVLEKLGHDYECIDTKDATCTEDGYKKYECSRCHDIKTTTFEKLGHDMILQTDLSYAPTCTEDGKNVYHCSRCNHTEEIPLTKLGHDYTCDTVKETCTANGTETYTCQRCGHVYTKTIPMHAHNFIETARVNPTYTSMGYIVTTCEECKQTHIEYLPVLTVTNTPDLTNPYAPVIDNRNNNSNGHSEENDFTVPEKKASIKVTAQTKKANVTWEKVSHATGYQVQCSTSKKFNKNKKTSSTNKLKKTIKGLKKGKTYYIRVRAYSMDSGMRYYAPWSSVKKVKIKK